MRREFFGNSGWAVFLGVFMLAGCTSANYYGMTELFHGKPVPVESIPRNVLGPAPSGVMPSHDPHSILVMDSGADYLLNSDSFSYLTNLRERYMDSYGQGDLPVHFFLDFQGIVYAGRSIVSPAQIYKNDAFALRLSEVERQEALLARLNRYKGHPLKLDGYIVIMVLGDYDRQMLTEEQERNFFQLLSTLVYEHKIPLEQIYPLDRVYEETNNPGFYLKNYLQLSKLKEHVPPPPVKHRFLIPPTVQKVEG